MEPQSTQNTGSPRESESFRTEHQPDSFKKPYANGEQNQRAVRSLGWFSIGLGLTQILIPGRLSRFIGVPTKPRYMRMLGVRELASGVGIFSKQRNATPLWARVGGDVMDLALLSKSLGKRKANRGRIVAATVAVAGVTALDYYYSKRLSNGKSADEDIKAVVTINRAPEDLYRFWRDFQNLPRFMKYIESVEPMGTNRSRWHAKLPGGKRIEWVSELTEDSPDHISWRSVEGSDVHHAGSVRFVPNTGGRGTRITLQMTTPERGGMLGQTLAKLFKKVPEQIAQEDLRAFKQLMETGEIATTEGQPSGQRGVVQSIVEAGRKE